jgi:hypothetical protein
MTKLGNILAMFVCMGKTGNFLAHFRRNMATDKGNNKITELRAILQRESQNS